MDYEGTITNEDAESLRKKLYPLLEDDAEKSRFDDIIANVLKDDEERKEEMAVVPEFLLEKPVSTVAEVISAVLDAKRKKKVLRVVGSRHSARDAIFPTHGGTTLVLMGELRKVEFLKEQEENGNKWLYCRVGGGCNLGKDPMNCHSTVDNSVCYQVAQKGFGFPELGGIIYQTVGGFIMTGSAGGSLRHGFDDVIREIEFVDGTGTLKKAVPETDLWHAVGVSMGLFGVITHVTFRLPELNLITGEESGYKFADSSLGPNDEGKSRLRESLEKHEYFRVNWFPQKDVKRVQEWVGWQTITGDIIPYKSVISCLFVAGTAAVVLKVCNSILQKPNPSPIDYKIIGTLLTTFVPIKSKKFCDKWFKTLPMDNDTHVDSIVKVDFTEIWMPIDQCQTVIDKLDQLFENQNAAGNFATEMYSAKKAPFWLSMSYGGDMVRVDPYWWAYNRGDMRQYFSLFWDVLLDVPGTRLHWGKYLPKPGQKCGTKTFNLAYLKSVYPKMDDWLKKREEMDPDQVFVTEYWRGIFEIPPKRNGFRDTSCNFI